MFAAFCQADSCSDWRVGPGNNFVWCYDRAGISIHVGSEVWLLNPYYECPHCVEWTGEGHRYVVNTSDMALVLDQKACRKIDGCGTWLWSAMYVNHAVLGAPISGSYVQYDSTWDKSRILVDASETSCDLNLQIMTECRSVFAWFRTRSPSM
eukprot:ANDGO_07508.mRNA.1 hypothetical protein